jgi:hypothetical protein
MVAAVPLPLTGPGPDGVAAGTDARVGSCCVKSFAMDCEIAELSRGEAYYFGAASGES